MEMITEMQQPRKRCSKCSKLKIMTDYGTKKNGGQFMTCVTCRRRYSTLKDETMNTEDTKPKKRPRRCLTIQKAIKIFIRSMGALTLKCLTKD